MKRLFLGGNKNGVHIIWNLQNIYNFEFIHYTDTKSSLYNNKKPVQILHSVDNKKMQCLCNRVDNFWGKDIRRNVINVMCTSGFEDLVPNYSDVDEKEIYVSAFKSRFKRKLLIP